MKKYITLSALSIFILFMGSCKKDFLEVVPKGKLIAKTYQDYDLLMNASSFYIYDAKGIYEMAMMMGDEVGANEAYYISASAGSNIPGALFRWDTNVFLQGNNIGDTADDPPFLRKLHSNLYLCNKIISEVGTSSGGTDSQKAGLIAEAKAERAFIYFQIVNYFGKPYVQATASQDLGWPVITTADVSASDFKRNSLQEVYDFIIQDFTQAIPGLRRDPVSRTRMSKAAAEGLLGKVYLSMGRNNDALGMFNAAFNDIAAMANPPKLYDYNKTFDATTVDGGTFLPVNPISGPNSPYNNIQDLTESVVAVNSYASTNSYGAEMLLLSPGTTSLFDNKDLRLNFYTNLQTDGATPNPQNLLRRYDLKYAKVGLELPELYLLRAEARAKTDDLVGSKADLETLREKRMPTAQSVVPGPDAANKLAIVRFVINERIREFAGQGYRWFDMRRFSVDPLFTGLPQTKHVLYLTGGGTREFTLNPTRLTLKIPNVYLRNNPQMIDNP